ncbi:hypothetical protein WICPIJ_008944 [Wickerhamomyces pijperi]|uniref:Uncharacterized protein n=1 Tax=Wickerhamomyces pijperi TaxID=599730 RepID=A0A9P8TG66_WICPI|nr:hypothetical protein WICPIJ_008944 [Wickerhamomyces pijperi]
MIFLTSVGPHLSAQSPSVDIDQSLQINHLALCKQACVVGMQTRKSRVDGFHRGRRSDDTGLSGRAKFAVDQLHTVVVKYGITSSMAEIDTTGFQLTLIDLCWCDARDLGSQFNQLLSFDWQSQYDCNHNWKTLTIIFLLCFIWDSTEENCPPTCSLSSSVSGLLLSALNLEISSSMTSVPLVNSLKVKKKEFAKNSSKPLVCVSSVNKKINPFKEAPNKLPSPSLTISSLALCWMTWEEEPASNPFSFK